MDRRVTVVLVAVVAHLLAGVAHGYAHDGAGVQLTTGQTAFVWVVATAGPIAAAILVWRGAIRSGALLLVATALAATIFDGYYHVIAETPDHVHAVDGPFADLFIATAILVSITDVLCVLAGAWLYRQVSADTDADRSARVHDGT
ncbi:hypothetical protein [Natronoglomus mannanivorans]|uniref:Uncharacterized protein n=1 Tax=Natronoglomus mannanivorans TaxID=2979990 RepID=A0AAP3E3B8_9EURY|nr:hypothetical protein [Halobacteria archaeon AArc-xg1-1]